MTKGDISVLSREELSCSLDSATTSFFRWGKSVVSANGTQQLCISLPLTQFTPLSTQEFHKKR